MPLTCGYWPVASAARLPEQVGAGAEGLAEDHALLGEPLDARRADADAVGLDLPAGVVRVEVEDVGRHDGFPIGLV